MTAIRLWGRPTSVNVQKVLWMLHELGLEYEHKIVGGVHGGLSAAEFRNLTPMPRVPVLEIGAVAIWESHAILRYLARSISHHELVIDTPEHAAQIDMWMELVSTTLQPPFIGLFWQMVRMKEQDRSTAKIEECKKSMMPALKAMSSCLEHSSFLVGDRFSLADIAAGSLLYRLTDIAPDITDSPAIQRWYQELQQRPAYRNIVMTTYDELRAC